MGIKLDMVGIVVKDMKRALDFYRILGFDIAEDADKEIHVEVDQNGVRLAFDTQELAKEVYGGWKRAGRASY
ncbi:VOC family protein [Siminovitchia sp. 179-K 8D1 HS]|uniref:VOC family protein n=1 Tax=Siminovitchia sp. 179-K 8D1 HS TaxID=3142385 RepID=UPI00399F6B78